MERSGFKNGRAVTVQGEVNRLYTYGSGDNLCGQRAWDKNCSPGQSAGGKFPTLCITGGETFPDGIATTRRITTGLSRNFIINRFAPSSTGYYTARSTPRLTTSKFLKFARVRKIRFLSKCIRNCFFFKRGKFKTGIFEKILSHIFLRIFHSQF